ncbi:MAG: hypothetical protein WBL61_11470 [Bryobacteraceae bacterium]
MDSNERIHSLQEWERWTLGSANVDVISMKRDFELNRVDHFKLGDSRG